MFGLLKNKLSGFIKGLTGREEKKAEATEKAAPPEGKIGAAAVPERKNEPAPFIEPKAEKPPERKPAPQPAQVAKIEQVPTQKIAVSLQSQKVPEPKAPERKAEPKAAPSERKSLLESVAGAFSAKNGAPKPDEGISRLEKKAQEQKRDLAPKVGIGTTIKSFFSSEITIGESEVSDLLEELELSLLEADVAYEVSTEVTSQLRAQLVGMRVPKGEIEKRTKETVQKVLESVMDSGRKFNFVERVKGAEKPVKILFVGPNGAGKTTTMAKVARMLLDAGLTVVFAASDTFRAAAIEQTEVHAGRLGIKAIKSKYGADPASVAFDAINYAKANSIDVVLIDSAGRQDTNANLLSELIKINRISRPDIKLYVGESIGGNAVIDQIRAFNAAIGMDGAILTKIDCDAKGGTAISIAKSTGIPVLFLGVGQGYSDLVPFDPHRIAQEIMT